MSTGIGSHKKSITHHVFVGRAHAAGRLRHELAVREKGAPNRDAALAQQLEALRKGVLQCGADQQPRRCHEADRAPACLHSSRALLLWHTETCPACMPRVMGLSTSTRSSSSLPLKMLPAA